jgi:ActR/RegA family two-component response regulator
LWKPNGNAAANDYQFTVIELRLNAKGDGEGKASLSGKVAADANAKAVLLDGYATMPIVLKAVKKTQ